MRAFNQEWLVRRAAVTGTLACGLRGPNGRALCHSVEASCSSDQMEKILGQFDSIRTTIGAGPTAPRWSTWVFEQGLIRLVERPDQWLLAIVVRHDSDAAIKLDGICQEFLGL